MLVDTSYTFTAIRPANENFYGYSVG